MDEGQRSGKRSIDLATVLGLVSGFGLLISALFLGGNPKAFIDIPSVLIVVGGTVATTTACFSLSDMGKSVAVIFQTIFHATPDPSEAAVKTLEIAVLARKQGVLALQNVLPVVRNEPFLHKGLAMVVDGTPGDDIEVILRRDLQATIQRHQRSTSILRKASEFAPALGLIGTLIGLVQMLGNLDDPSTIGPSMAVALITTFYGAVLSNMLFLPLAAKLERNSAEEALINSVFLTGAASVGRQENPRRLEMLINSLLPPAKRVRFFD